MVEEFREEDSCYTPNCDFCSLYGSVDCVILNKKFVRMSGESGNGFYMGAKGERMELVNGSPEYYWHNSMKGFTFN